MLNKVKNTSNMYGFIDCTVNPLAGECFHACRYCYQRNSKRPAIRNKYSKKPHFDEKYGNLNLYKHGKGNNIFVCSMTDLFSDTVPDNEIENVLDLIFKFPENIYFFQTRNIFNLNRFILPRKSIVCTTIESNINYPGISKAPFIESRVEGMRYLSPGLRRMITIEPIMKFDLNELLNLIVSVNPEQINIGADSGRNGLIEPNRADVIALISALENININVHQKPNLKRLLG